MSEPKLITRLYVEENYIKFRDFLSQELNNNFED